MRRLPADLAALERCGKAALARCLSALESAPDDPALTALLEAAWGAPRGTCLGLTGPPGVGKSTLIGALVARLRARGETVAVIAVDPSSRLSGGALLGDRTRIETDPDDPGSFVRSMAARSRLGGVADLTFPAAVLMRACFDWVLIETVGVGQSETEVSDCADFVVFCVQPGAGDALQYMKAGVMEVPDLVLVTKADLGAPAARAVADVRAAVSLAAASVVPVIPVSALSGEGLADAVERLAAAAGGSRESADLAVRRRAQGAAWARARLVDSFGSVGHAALATRIDPGSSPFASLSELANRAKTAVHQALKDL